MRIWTILAGIFVLLAIAFGSGARADMLLMYGGSRGSAGPPPTCAVNFSTQLNDKCHSIFVRGR